MSFKTRITGVMIGGFLLASAQLFALELSVMPGLKKFQGQDPQLGYLMVVAPELIANIHLKVTGDTDFKDYFQGNVLGKIDLPIIPFLFYFYPQAGVGFDLGNDKTSLFKAGAGFKFKLITLLAINIESNYTYMPSAAGKHAGDVFGGLMLDF